MADSDKNIVITPQTSQTADPTIEFKSGATSGDPITLNITDDGTTSSLSFAGSAGQLFSITNDLTGTIFAVADGSGIPIIEADADGTVRIAEFGGQLDVGGAITTTEDVTVAGTLTANAVVSSLYMEEVELSSTTSGTFNIDVNDDSILFLDTAMTANWTINVRGDATNTDLNTVLAVGDSLTVVCLATQGSPAYYNNDLTINAVAQTVKWSGGAAPVSGTASGVDSYSYTIIKTAASTYTVLGNVTNFT